MTNNKVLAALCYFSIFFAPLLLPIIVYFVTDDREVKYHAKRSLLSHLIPVVLLIVVFVIMIFSMMSFRGSFDEMTENSFSFWQFAPFLFMLIYGLLFMIIFIWNVIQGVKVLK
ncbi:DUF4870 domain-containing protein [Sporosarcina limicola]|uniref:Membrane protein n=1 Tax=Sporosarcina limicola TaxID=34101 RepID=A0A927R7D8_9BACL|nr:DUF4870 domain-containing protein [Sporosarcina limicola]MBE1555884.1 putative membrane protein [Sporosarcina limicola]